MKDSAQRNSILMILALICTLSIIGTNYMFTQNIITDLEEKLMEKEYQKIGGKENYIIMQEIQRREILSYIDQIKENEPEFIEEILEKHDLEESWQTLEYKTLSENIINDLKKNTYIHGNTWALVSIIEFSDLECPFCIDQHLEWAHLEMVETSSGSINYMYKNFPLPAHKNAGLEAQAAKCVETLEWWEKYLEYIDLIFNNTDWGWEGFKIEDLWIFAEKLSVSREDFETCMLNESTKDIVEREFKQWVMLKITSVPSTLVVNNETGKYTIVSQKIGQKELVEIINEVK